MRLHPWTLKPWMIDLADDHFALDIGRARKALGWEPKRSLRETLPRMVSALKSDPARFYKAHFRVREPRDDLERPRERCRMRLGCVKGRGDG